MRVAAVVPARNAAGTLSRCLAAIRKSGGDEVELVVVHDGSTDRTSQVAGACGAAALRQDTAVLSALAALVGPGWSPRLRAWASCGSNRPFYGCLARRRGSWFLVRAFPLHLLYYACSSATFAWAWVRHIVSRLFDTAPRRRVDTHLVS